MAVRAADELADLGLFFSLEKARVLLEVVNTLEELQVGRLLDLILGCGRVLSVTMRVEGSLHRS